jgi:hypothetical protein
LHKKKLKRKKLAEAEESWKFARDFGVGVWSFFLRERERERGRDGETERNRERFGRFSGLLFCTIRLQVVFEFVQVARKFFCFGSGLRRRRRRSLFPVSLTWSEASEAGVLEAVVG